MLNVSTGIAYPQKCWSDGLLTLEQPHRLCCPCLEIAFGFFWGAWDFLFTLLDANLDGE